MENSGRLHRVSNNYNLPIFRSIYGDFVYKNRLRTVSNQYTITKQINFNKKFNSTKIIMNV